jgi:hypothetical protein
MFKIEMITSGSRVVCLNDLIINELFIRMEDYSDNGFKL